jgi:intracellular sulfur oxidation DsrE/DsrF family protein
MRSSRKAFLGAAAASIATSGALAPAQPVRAASAGSPISYDALLAIARKPARHRQLFAATRPNGNACVYMRNSLNGYERGWGEPAGSLHAVAVFNGMGVVQGLDDDAWRRYRIADVLATMGAPLVAGLAVDRNPWLRPAPGVEDRSIEALQRRGCDFLVCDTALGTASMMFARAGHGDDATIHAALRRVLIPGAHLVPSGVSAINALQEERFTLYDANV